MSKSTLEPVWNQFGTKTSWFQTSLEPTRFGSKLVPNWFQMFGTNLEPIWNPSNLSNLSYPSNPSNLSNLSNPSNPSNLPGSAATTLLQIPSTKLYAACVPGCTLRTVLYVVFVARWLQRLDTDTNRPDTNWQCCNHRATNTKYKIVRGVRPRMHSAYSFARGICSTVVEALQAA